MSGPSPYLEKDKSTVLICRECSASFSRKPGPGRNPHFCSDACRSAAGRGRLADIGRPDRRGKRGVLREPRTVACKQCGTEFVSTHGRRIHCSVLCRERYGHEQAKAEKRPYLHYPRCPVYFRDCGWCGVLYASRAPRSNACSDDCRRKFNARHMRERYSVDPEAAARRVREQRAVRSDEQRRRDQERARAWRERAGYFESKRAGDQRRRARKLAAEVEKFTAAEIYERDRWRCGICSKKVRASLKHPHPMSASLDHIVPLSLGGDHTRANARLAHLSCNVGRGNRMGTEQLALIG